MCVLIPNSGPARAQVLSTTEHLSSPLYCTILAAPASVLCSREHLQRIQRATGIQTKQGTTGQSARLSVNLLPPTRSLNQEKHLLRMNLEQTLAEALEEEKLTGKKALVSSEGQERSRKRRKAQSADSMGEGAVGNLGATFQSYFY